jgi:hypothetical protein
MHLNIKIKRPIILSALKLWNNILWYFSLLNVWASAFTNLLASTSCYRDSFIFYLIYAGHIWSDWQFNCNWITCSQILSQHLNKRVH